MVFSGTEKKLSKQVVEKEVGLEMRTWCGILSKVVREDHARKVLKAWSE